MLFHLLLCLAPLSASAPDSLAIPATPAAKPQEPVPFATLARQPAAFLGRRVRLVLQFHSLEETWNPFVTRFATTEYVGVRAWSDEQLPWRPDDYERQPVRVFAPRDGDGLEAFFRLGQRHERIAVTCIVREVFAGQPWIEVLGAEVLPESIPEGSVLHAIRALDFEEKHAYGLALGELERAEAAPLPEHARRALAQIRARCVEAQGKD